MTELHKNKLEIVRWMELGIGLIFLLGGVKIIAEKYYLNVPKIEVIITLGVILFGGLLIYDSLRNIIKPKNENSQSNKKRFE